MVADTKPAGADRLRVAQVVGLATIVPFVLVIAAIAVGVVTLSHQSAVRNELLNRVEPADAASLSLQTALLNEETGVRGYELSAIPSFLDPYRTGRAAAKQALTVLSNSGVTGTRQPLALVNARVGAWERDVALPAIARVTPGHPHAAATVDAVMGKRRFDQIRRALASLQSAIAARLGAVKRSLNSAARTTDIVLVAIGLALLLSVIAVAVTLRNTVERPLAKLTRASREVGGGDLSRSLLVTGPEEIATVSRDVDAMRVRLVAALESSHAARDELAAAGAELERSNSELEQFAYIASHDLQEPLRKVTSFCQLLQDRYAGQLDERADSYIEFAVDGARRMQQLVNDLLSFSRVGRTASRREPTDLGSLARGAARDLLPSGDGDGDGAAEVVIGELPTLEVVPGLVRAVFQNLIANALKVHGERPPHVEVSARRRDEVWELACADNGIGIDPQYAERIFVIFQRLHPRNRYEGTGIGLAMCRKIIEYHGGEIWLDTEFRGGARVLFTLPADSDTMPR